MLLNIIKKHQFSFGHIFLILLYSIYLIFLHFSVDIQHIDLSLINILLIVASFISLTALHLMIEIITNKSVVLYRTVTIATLSIYEIFYLYHYRMWDHFDYKVLADNWDELFNPQALPMVNSIASEILQVKDYLNITLFIFIICYFGLYKKRLFPRQLNHKFKKLVAAIIVLITSIMSPLYFFDELTFVAQSIYQHHFPAPSKYNFARDLKDIDYPYIHYSQSNFTTNKKAPNIIIVAIESLNANFINKKTSSGQEYTPIYNSHIAQGLFFENFYGHSVQTAKGHFSILCGLPPLIKGKAFKVKNINFNCLPQILKDYGHQTYFIQGYQQSHFDNTKDFMTRNGFDNFEVTDISNMSKHEQDKFIWGFGPQDNFTYIQAFKSIDQLHKESPQKPIFAMIATISNHMDFTAVPSDQRYIFPQPSSQFHHHANAVRVSDKYLETFFQELAKRKYLTDNTLIVITGDHGFPAGEHGSFINASGSHKELFKTPLLMLWTGKIKPKIEHRYFSQQNIAPSILDLIGWSGKNHFKGQSIFHPNQISQIIPLIQPYNGIHIGGIMNRKKFILQQRVNKYTLYDLHSDPDETVNMFSNELSSYGKFDQMVKDVYRNQYIILNNKVWDTKRK